MCSTILFMVGLIGKEGPLCPPYVARVLQWCPGGLAGFFGAAVNKALFV